MSRSEFVEIDTIRDPECNGLVASITMRRKHNGFLTFSFAIFKEFERRPGAPTQRTVYLGEHQLDAAQRLLVLIERRIAEEHDKLHAKQREQRAQ